METLRLWFRFLPASLFLRYTETRGLNGEKRL